MNQPTSLNRGTNLIVSLCVFLGVPPQEEFAEWQAMQASHHSATAGEKHFIQHIATPTRVNSRRSVGDVRTKRAYETFRAGQISAGSIAGEAASPRSLASMPSAVSSSSSSPYHGVHDVAVQ